MTELSVSDCQALAMRGYLRLVMTYGIAAQQLMVSWQHVGVLRSQTSVCVLSLVMHGAQLLHHSRCIMVMCFAYFASLTNSQMLAS